MIKLLAAGLFLTGSLQATDIVSSSRRVTWEGNAGIPGGIPDSSTMAVASTFSSSATRAQVQTALTSAASNTVVHLQAGTYNWSGNLDYTGIGNGKVLKGDVDANGIPTTRIKVSNAIIYMRKGSFDEGALSVEANLTADGNKGDTTITLSSVPSWVTVGDLIAIDELDEPAITEDSGQEGGSDNYREAVGNGARGLAQLLKVSAKNSTTITFTPALSETFKTAQTAQIFQPARDPSSAGALTRCGIENIIYEHTGTAATDNHMIKMELAKECWLKNVWGTNCVGGIYVYGIGTFNCEIRHCYFDNCKSLGGGQAYGVAFYHWCTGNLVEDNIFRKLHVSMQNNYGSCYNVFAYNFETDGQSTSGQNPSMSTHGNASHMVLFEGNWCMDKYLGDFTHGGGYAATVFRNRIVGKNPNQSGDQRPISNERYNRLFNCVGNVLGDKSFHTHFIEAPSGGGYTGLGGSVTSNCQDDAIFALGYWANISCDLTAQDSFATMNPIFAVNYNVVTSTNNGVVLGSSQLSDLGNSYYVSSKPAIFQSLTWPPFGPDITASTNTTSYTRIPAGYRYANGTEVPAASGGGTGFSTRAVGNLRQNGNVIIR